jgi:hypothetical protein
VKRAAKAVSSEVASASRFAKRVELLTTLDPSSAMADNFRIELERDLMLILQQGGRRAGERAVRAIRVDERPMELVSQHATLSYYGMTIGDGKAALKISFNVNRYFKSAGITYDAIVPPPKRTAAERKRDAMHEEFYQKYTELAQRYYRPKKPPKISAQDRLMLLVGDLEGDVNNGGFSQYLVNKGRRTATAALKALETIGAKKTATLLRRALAPDVADAELEGLDRKFIEVPDDLAVLVMRHRAR